MRGEENEGRFPFHSWLQKFFFLFFLRISFWTSSPPTRQIPPTPLHRLKLMRLWHMGIVGLVKFKGKMLHKLWLGGDWKGMRLVDPADAASSRKEFCFSRMRAAFGQVPKIQWLWLKSWVSCYCLLSNRFKYSTNCWLLTAVLPVLLLHIDLVI